MKSYQRYQSLVQEAWQNYCQGNHAGMARSLEHSLKCTPYLKSETISDWLTQFTEFSQAEGQEFYSTFLVDIPDWNQLIKLSLYFDSFQNYKPDFDNSIIIKSQIISDIPKKLNYKILYNFLSLNIQKHDIKIIKKVIEHIEQNQLISESMLFRCCYFVVKETDLNLAFSYGYHYFELSPDDEKFAEVLLNISCRLGRLKEAEAISKTINKYTMPTIKEDLVFVEKIIDRFDEVIDFPDSNTDRDFQTIQKYVTQNSWIKQKILNQIKEDINLNQDKKNQKLEKVFELTQDIFFAKQLACYHRNYGSLKKSLNLLKYVEKASGLKESITELVEGEVEILEQGFPGINASLNPQKKHIKRNHEINILYVIHNSLPYKSVGYAIRSHYITQSLVEQQVKVNAVTRLGFPNDEIDIQKFPLSDQVDQVIYHRLKSSDAFYNKTPFPHYLWSYTKSLLNFASKYQPTILHSASNFINGVTTNHVAKILGIPSIYEVRGLWEITRASKDPYYENSDLFKMMKRMEVDAAMNATVVVTLTEALKRELVERGVPCDKITVISNAADPEKFKPSTRDKDLESLFRHQNKVVIGYIGSVVEYEGIEYILWASAILKAKGFQNFAVLIVGDGNYLDQIKLLCSQLDLKDVVTFTGRVSHQGINRYYSLVDIMTYPRKGQPVCEMVSPLKPFEAMSMEKCVVASDVAALKEIVNDGVTGLLHKKDDVEDLARTLEVLIKNNSLITKLGKSARQWIKKEKNWQIISKKIMEVYQSVSN